MAVVINESLGLFAVGADKALHSAESHERLKGAKMFLSCASSPGDRTKRNALSTLGEAPQMLKMSEYFFRHLSVASAAAFFSSRAVFT